VDPALSSGTCRRRANLARNTQHSYRDALVLLISFVAKIQKSPSIVWLSSISRLIPSADFSPISSPRAATCNQRLAAIRALAGFVAVHDPAHIEWRGQIRSIPFKKAGKALVP
jgi:integrase/recombinase XerD